MVKCKHCKREVNGSHHCEPREGFLDKLADAVGDLLDTFSAGGDSDSGCDSGGGCD